MYMLIYIYIYRERERYRYTHAYIHTYMCTHVIYTHTFQAQKGSTSAAPATNLLLLAPWGPLLALN